jgi:hypothetical protein
VDQGGSVSVEGPHSPHSGCHAAGHEDADADVGIALEADGGDCSDLTVDVQGVRRVERFDGKLYCSGGVDHLSPALHCAAAGLSWVEAWHSGARVALLLVPACADLAALRAVILVI